MAASELKYLILATVFLSACGHDISENNDFSAATAPTNSQEDGIEYSNTVASPKDMRAGDIFFVGYDGAGRGQVDLSGVDEEAQFTLVLGAGGLESSSQTVKTSADMSPEEKLDQALRDRETSLALSADFVSPRNF